ncbi:MAG: hypothetical protein 2 [Zeugodacus tau negev-like virus]|nr:MAG: hypothetical protein 2 [Zeugodacus tau negev-like virus]
MYFQILFLLFTVLFTNSSTVPATKNETERVLLEGGLEINLLDDTSIRSSPTIKDKFVAFCCSCVTNKANCPICVFRGTTRCPKSLSAILFDEMVTKGVANYQKYTNTAEYSIALGNATFYTWDDSKLVLSPIENTRCSRTPVTIRTGIYSEMEQCTVVTRLSGECPRADLTVSNTCGWLYATELKLDSDYKACIAPYIYDFEVTVFQNRKGLCTRTADDVYSPLLTDILPVITKLSVIPSAYVPKPLGRVDKQYYFETQDVSDFYWFLKHFSQNAVSTNYARPSTTKFKFITDSAAFSDSTVYNGSPSFLIDKVIMDLACTPISFTSSQTFCREALLTNSVYIAPTLSNRSHTTRYSVYAGNIDVPEMNFTFPCNKFTDIGFCSLQKVLNEFQFNFTKTLNDSMVIAVNLFTDIMGANDTKLYSYSVGGKTNRLVGNWFSGIFASLIEPFFEAFVNIVLKAFLPPLFEAITDFLLLVSDALSSLTKNLISIISQLGNALSDLLTNLLNLLLGILCFIETHVLLFEYTLVFLFILCYVIDDPIFAGIIVIILMLVLGIVRRSPSLIMHFISNDFLLFNFTDYYNREFDWGYSISYTSGRERHTLFLINGTSLKTQIY